MCSFSTHCASHSHFVHLVSLGTSPKSNQSYLGHPTKNKPEERIWIGFDLEGRYNALHISRAEEIHVLSWMAESEEK